MPPGQRVVLTLGSRPACVPVFGAFAPLADPDDRPASATDRIGCWPSAAEPASTDLGDCASAFPPVKDKRVVAGGP